MSRSLAPLLALGAALGLLALAGGDSPQPSQGQPPGPKPQPPGPKPGDRPPPTTPQGGSPLGQKLAARARETDGWGWGNEDTRVPYTLHCLPGDKGPDGKPTAWALKAAGAMSSCLLHIRGLYAECGVDGMVAFASSEASPFGAEPVDVLRVSFEDYARRFFESLNDLGDAIGDIDVLRVAYEKYIGSVETMLYKLAEKQGARIDNAWQEKPALEPGDAVIVGIYGQAPDDPKKKEDWLASWGGVAHGSMVCEIQGETIFTVDGGQADPENPGHSTAIRGFGRKLKQDSKGRWWLGTRRINYIIKASKLRRIGNV